MKQSNISVQSKLSQAEPSASADFEENHAKYRNLLAEMDRVDSIDGIKYFFRQLSGLLARMEQDLRFQGKHA